MLCYILTLTRLHSSLFLSNLTIYRAFNPSDSALIVYNAPRTASFPLDRGVQTRVEYVSRMCIFLGQCKAAEEPLSSNEVTPPPVTSKLGHLPLPFLDHAWTLVSSMTYQYVLYQVDWSVPRHLILGLTKNTTRLAPNNAAVMTFL